MRIRRSKQVLNPTLVLEGLKAIIWHLVTRGLLLSDLASWTSGNGKPHKPLLSPLFRRSVSEIVSFLVHTQSWRPLSRLPFCLSNSPNSEGQGPRGEDGMKKINLPSYFLQLPGQTKLNSWYFGAELGVCEPQNLAFWGRRPFWIQLFTLYTVGEHFCCKKPDHLMWKLVFHVFYWCESVTYPSMGTLLVFVLHTVATRHVPFLFHVYSLLNWNTSREFGVRSGPSPACERILITTIVTSLIAGQACKLVLILVEAFVASSHWSLGTPNSAEWELEAPSRTGNRP